MAGLEKTSNETIGGGVGLTRPVGVSLRMVRLFDHGKERKQIAHGGIGEMFPEKPAKARPFEGADPRKAQPVPGSIGPHDLRIRDQHGLRKLDDQGQPFSHREEAGALDAAPDIGEIKQEGLADPAGCLARRVSQRSACRDAIGLSLIRSG